MPTDERTAINHYLGRKGLATLDNPSGLMAQLGFLIADAAGLKRLLNKCEPRLRREMYESLRPHLSFEPKPLDVYNSEMAADAEARQLPTMDEHGNLHPYEIPEIWTEEEPNAIDELAISDLAVAQAAVNESTAKGHLVLVCRKCTKQATFPGQRMADAIFAARNAGWTYGLDAEGKGREICPDC